MQHISTNFLPPEGSSQRKTPQQLDYARAPKLQISQRQECAAHAGRTHQEHKFVIHCHERVRWSSELTATACAREGFVFGDPQAFLDSPCQSVTGRPDYAHCPHCQPPVHGVVLLLARSSEGGEVKAVDGRNAGRCERTQGRGVEAQHAAIAASVPLGAFVICTH
eukprot:418463-Pleurochrysis_carterae.AAC.2